ncbi:MAG: alpha/beta hydrolase [Verrucomicrobia bacterium]|nr:alpha/beta hydrolase [Verrucomicrobiota bacterium]MBV8482557.1 alpha/beta hydrolase [Verrucomicrobiota bacterium]
MSFIGPALPRIRTISKVIGIVIVSGTIFARGADRSDRNTLAAEPVVVPRAQQYDITSKINGLKYRIMVSTPRNADPGKRYPAFYILDGNWYFLPAVGIVPDMSEDLLTPIFVGIGYPTEDGKEIDRRRTFDLTPPGKQKDPFGIPAGGGDNFVRVLLEEIKPLVETRYQIDQARQIIYGKSYGGLLVIHLLFAHPEAFQTYLISSPAIFWDNCSVLAGEKDFSQKIKTSNLRLKVLITSASEEQYRGSDLKLQAEEIYRMVDNASELAGRLATASPQNLSVTYTVFPDETHVSVSLAALGRALYFALKP